MVKLQKDKKTEVVFVDINILFSNGIREIVNSEYKDFYNEYSDEFKLQLMIPEVVKGELNNFYTAPH